MRAVGYASSLPASDTRSLFEFETARPEPGPYDLLVRIRAVSINPLDAVVRMRKSGTDASPVILGFDGAGVVEAKGPMVDQFNVGDDVFYAGSLNRAGSNAEYQIVDARVAAAKPRTCSYEEAASLPLATITAWESLFDRLSLPTGQGASGDAILIVGAAGGVGSMALQLARRLTPLRVIVTASRAASRDWVRSLGAEEVIDHRQPLDAELAKLGVANVRYILSLGGTEQHWGAMTAALAPQGHICVADNPQAIDLAKLRGKAGALHFEMMWVRVIFDTPEIVQIGRLLSEVAALVDAGLVVAPVSEHLGLMSAETLQMAHRRIEGGSTVGKLVLSGFAD